jgi:hypothetical protein
MRYLLPEHYYTLPVDPDMLAAEVKANTTASSTLKVIGNPFAEDISALILFPFESR